MDDNVNLIRKESFPSVNILCENTSLEDALKITLNSSGHNVYTPIIIQKKSDGYVTIEKLGYLYSYNYENYSLTDFFFEKIRTSNTYFANILDMPNTLKDVRYRQNAVIELSQNRDLTEDFRKILSQDNIFEFIGHPSMYGQIIIGSNFSPEKMKWFLDAVSNLDKYSLKSESLIKLVVWSKTLHEDTLFKELFNSKRKITDSRIISLYTERFKGVKYGILKPGINPEDVFDFLEKDLSIKKTFSINKRSGKSKEYERSVIKYQTPYDKKIESIATANIKQKMDVLNTLAAENFILQILFTNLQMQQIYQGAVLYHTLNKSRIPVTFPKLKNEPGLMHIEQLMPIRLILADILKPRKMDLKKYCTNDFHFTAKDQLILVEGPNHRGKSEAWRSINLSNLLINAGYPIPAKTCDWGINPDSHFISCKGNMGHGGSELVHSIDNILTKLQYVKKDEIVILDELGDSTNKYVAEEMAYRLLTPLKEKGCKVFITSHHDAISNLISDKLEGKIFMPNNVQDEVLKYKLIPVNPDAIIDYKANEVLDEFDLTEEKVRKILSSATNKKILLDNPLDDDLPF